MFDLNNKVAVITGGAGALGGTIADYLAKNGVKVAILGRTSETVHNKVEELKNNGGEAIALVADALNKESLQRANQILLDQ